MLGNLQGGGKETTMAFRRELEAGEATPVKEGHVIDGAAEGGGVLGTGGAAGALM